MGFVCDMTLFEHFWESCSALSPPLIAISTLFNIIYWQVISDMKFITDLPLEGMFLLMFPF